MKTGVLFDLHGTLTDSNDAWKAAFKGLVRSEDFKRICQRIDNKESRQGLCAEYGLDYKQLIVPRYRENLKRNKFGCTVLEQLSKLFDVYLVTNSSREKTEKDLDRLGLSGKFKKIYTKEDGRKPSKSYIEKVLKENNLDFAFIIGNDIEEDFILTEKVLPLIIDFKKCSGAME